MLLGSFVGIPPKFNSKSIWDEVFRQGQWKGKGLSSYFFNGKLLNVKDFIYAIVDVTPPKRSPKATI